MHLFYIDESGNTGADLRSVVEPVHWLVALGATEHAVHDIENDLISVASRYFKADARRPEFELHGSEIFAGRGPSRALTVTERVRLFADILSVIPRHGAKLWVRGIHKQRHLQRAQEKGYTPSHPYNAGFMFLVEKLDEYLASRQADLVESAASPKGDLGLLISDEQDEVSRSLISGFARWRQFGTDFGYKPRNIRYLIDTIHYVQSQDSWLIQLVDCVAFIRNRVEKIGSKHGWDASKYNPSDRAVSALWERHCKTSVADSRIWP